VKGHFVAYCISVSFFVALFLSSLSSLALSGFLPLKNTAASFSIKSHVKRTPLRFLRYDSRYVHALPAQILQNLELFLFLAMANLLIAFCKYREWNRHEMYTGQREKRRKRPQEVLVVRLERAQIFVDVVGVTLFAAVWCQIVRVGAGTHNHEHCVGNDRHFHEFFFGGPGSEDFWVHMRLRHILLQFLALELVRTVPMDVFTGCAAVCV